MQVICLIVITLSTFLLLGNSLAFASESHGRNYYIGAIFEHGRRGNKGSDTPDQIKQINLAYYKKATEAAKSKGADLIAFPEYGIIPPGQLRDEVRDFLETVPDPRNGSWNPCNMESEFSDRPILYELSCMAKNNTIVVLANMGDIQNCTKAEEESCPDDGAFFFNTNVVFDRNGTLISRYHKEHLFFELAMDLPPHPQDPYFTTDFGTFASFICFDSVFKPIAEALRNASADGVILSTMWLDIMPYLTSIQWWQSLSSGNGGTLLVANAQVPGYEAIGSGVFTAKMGTLKYTFNPDGESKLIVSRVPLLRNQVYPFPNPEASITVITPDVAIPYNETMAEEAENVPEICNFAVLGEPTDIYTDYRCFSVDTQNYTLIKLARPTDNIEACNNGMCCSLRYSANSMDESIFLAVFNGTYNSFNRYYWCQEVCFVARCLALNGSECANFPAKSETVFRKLELTANFSTSFVYPVLLESGVRAVPVNKWNFDVSFNSTGRIGELQYKNYLNSSLLVAGLSGRCFDRDPPYVR